MSKYYHGFGCGISFFSLHDYLGKFLRKSDMGKVEKILKGSLDSIPSPSPSMEIQNMVGKVCLRCKGKTFLGAAPSTNFLNKKFVDITQQLKYFEFSLKVKVMGLNPGYLLY